MCTKPVEEGHARNLHPHAAVFLRAAVINVQDLGSGPASSGGNAESFFTAADIRRKFEAPFLEVSTAGDWFRFFNSSILSPLSPLVWYNGNAFNASDYGYPGTGQPGTFRVLGPLSVRQVRVQINSCPSAFEADFRSQGLLEFCYGPFSDKFESNSNFGPPLSPGGPPRYEYSTAKETAELTFQGQAATYGGGGFLLLFQTDGTQKSRDESVALLNQLYKDLWIDRQTRAIFIDANLYNPVTNTLTLVRLIAEFPASGGILRQLSMRHVSLGMLYMDYAKSNTLVLEAAMLLLLSGFALLQLLRLRHLGVGAYLADRWGLYDLFATACFIVAYAYRWRALDMSKYKVFPPDNLTFTNYGLEAYDVVTYRNVFGLCAILSWARLFKTIKRMPSMDHIFQAIFTAIPDLAFLVVVLFCILFGFALAHYLAFGDSMSEFRTMHQSMLLLWQLFLGKDQVVEQMMVSNRVLGAFFYILWTFLSGIVVLYLFLGTVTDSFTKMRNERERVAFGEFVQKSLMRPIQRLLVRYKVPIVGEEAEARRDTINVQDLLTREIEATIAARQQEKEQQRRDVAVLTQRKRRKQVDRIDLLMQSLMTLSRETSLVSKRLRAVEDSDAPRGAQPDFFR